MIHRIWPHIRVSSRRPRHAQAAPSLRFPRRSKPRCWPRCGARGTATCWPSTSCCCARLDAPRRTSPRSCSARAPACTAPCEPIGQGTLGPGGTTTMGGSCRLMRTHRAAPHAAAVAAGPAQGAPAGVWLVPHALELCHAGPDAAGHTGDHGLRRDRCAAGSTRSAGCGSAPSWWPKTTIRTRVERLARIRFVFEQLKRV